MGIENNALWKVIGPNILVLGARTTIIKTNYMYACMHAPQEDNFRVMF